MLLCKVALTCKACPLRAVWRYSRGGSGSLGQFLDVSPSTRGLCFPVQPLISPFIQSHHKSQAGTLTSSPPPSTAVSPSPVKSMLTQALRSHGTRMASLSPWDKRFSSFQVGKLRLCAQLKAMVGSSRYCSKHQMGLYMWEDWVLWLLVQGSLSHRYPHTAAGTGTAS